MKKDADLLGQPSFVRNGKNPIEGMGKTNEKIIFKPFEMGHTMLLPPN